MFKRAVMNLCATLPVSSVDVVRIPQVRFPIVFGDIAVVT